MADNKESVELAKSLFTGEETIKSTISFKKGMIAGVLILILILCIGLLIGYGIGQGVATDHYTRLLTECQNKPLMFAAPY